jgi:hypothetical protein
MTTLTEKFAASNHNNDLNTATIGAYIDTVEAKLQLIAEEIDTMNVNAAANTKALLAALGQTGACFPCPTPPMTVPVVDPTITPINAEYCRRVQALIAAIENILTQMDTMQSFNVIGTYNVVSDAISEIINSIISGDTPPLPSFPETVNIVGDYVSYAGERIFSGTGLVEQFSPLKDGLRQAMYAAGSPDGSKAAYDNFIASSDTSHAGILLFQAVGYNALFNYFLSPDSSPDVSGYDGSACGLPGGCLTWTAEQWVTVDTEDGPKTIPDWSIYGVTVTSNLGHDNPVWAVGDWDNWSWVVEGATVYHEMLGVGGTSGTSPTGSFPDGSGASVTFVGSPASLTFCPPS